MTTEKTPARKAAEEALTLLRLIDENRHRCYIPNDKALIGWDDRVSTLLAEQPPTPSDAVREAAEALLRYHDACGMESSYGDALRAALAARGGECPACGCTGKGCACTAEERDAARGGE